MLSTCCSVSVLCNEFTRSAMRIEKNHTEKMFESVCFLSQLIRDLNFSPFNACCVVAVLYCLFHYVLQSVLQWERVTYIRYGQSTILYFIFFHPTLSYSALTYSFLLHYTPLYFTVLYCFPLFYTLMHFIELYCPLLAIFYSPLIYLRWWKLRDEKMFKYKLKRLCLLCRSSEVNCHMHRIASYLIVFHVFLESY